MRPTRLSGLGHRIARHQPGGYRVRKSWRGAGSSEGERDATRDREESRPQRPEDLWLCCREDHEIRMHGVDGHVQFLDRCVRAEVVDAPPVAVQHYAKDHQSEIMQLSGWAGEDRAWTMPASPTASEPREPAANDVAGEMLLGDAGRTTMPTITQLGEIGNEYVSQHGRQREFGHQPVQYGLRRGFIERVKRR
jgi:hypothetical protein